ncbi:fasciclin domain-containing protein [Pseudaestuariivita atlantica]|uniref:Fasciclin n=1 Tax=Pseudaestuariivita atlantica TaxID=1317121 RepID=A0A0L1JQQ9_9RHOB|nr:fasciclin domain-containing protein [Pseudaestuariivita atlantica]KNG94047.1 fasciclin [Pseudaestuariivita atlantica]
MTINLKTAALAAAVAMTATAGAAKSIVDIAAGDERFSTLVAAVSAAGLVDTLSGPGPFTVYAPVNDAFAALPEGTVEELLKPENRDQLVAVLTYHVDDRELAASDFAEGANYYKPVNTAERLCIDASSAGVSITDSTGEAANVIIANIEADNGIIHVIDKVLLPGARPACH